MDPFTDRMYPLRFHHYRDCMGIKNYLITLRQAQGDNRCSCHAELAEALNFLTSNFCYETKHGNRRPHYSCITRCRICLPVFQWNRSRNTRIDPGDPGRSIPADQPGEFLSAVFDRGIEYLLYEEVVYSCML